MINKDIDYAVANKQIGTPSLKMGDEFEMGIKGYHELKNGLKKWSRTFKQIVQIKRFYCMLVAVYVQVIPYLIYRIWDILL